MRTRLLALAALLGAAATTYAQNPTDTRLLAQPAMSATRVAFTYAGDLWSARLDGSDARRLPPADGDETSPSFSPDGALIAFTGNYDGNTDVYVIPAEGGTPRRLTWHPAPDIAQGFAPHRRPARALPSRPQRVDRRAPAALHRAHRGRRRGPAPDPERHAGHLFTGRPAHCLQPAQPRVQPMEALPRRPPPGDL